ncbi:hypothetical protein HHK36_014937 [Tetracentron sinense]|uniref:RING-type E3 ubiquitin transferase n=1 Tax=Tetracentron sinense TaxID=13715 RepID=A0A834Z5A6_TETSI|nr:hypothetical protein HHK36_014937 [Tetracentron sinense]
MAAVPENSAAEQLRFRKPRSKTISDPEIPSLIQSTRCKSTISSLFLSTFSTTMNTNGDGSNVSTMLKNKKKNFSYATFRGLGCATSSQVSAPAVIRSSADWKAKKVRKKKQRKKNPTPAVVVPDVWCTPGLAFAADADMVDCVVSRRPVAGRGRVDGERMNHRERSTARRAENIEHISVMDSPSTFETIRSGSDVFGSRHYRRFQPGSPEGLAEIMMFQGSLLLGRRSNGYDRYRDWRLDVDNMSYEELLELGDRIGYMSTGLREDEIIRCLRKTKHSILDVLPTHFPTEMERKCSICQEEYEADDEVGRLECGHYFHICCIKQWLLQKNACPVCKAAAQY